MSDPARVLRRLRLLLRLDRIERSMDDEIRHHLELETADLVARGLDPAAARREARTRFGGVERCKEEARDARGVRLVEDVAADLRYAGRLLRRHPGLTIAAAATLALGIGATTATLSVVYGVLLRPLPYADPAKLVVLWEHDVPRHRADNVVSLANFEAWRDRARSFSAMAAVIPTTAIFTDGADPERVVGAEITAGYFGLLGLAPALGRDFTAEDHAGTLAMILSDGYWRRRFGGDRSVIGRVRTISGRPYTIVGVMPPFDPPRMGWLDTQDIWFPMPRTEQRRSWGRSLIVLARLRDGVDAAAAQSEMVAIAARLAVEIPADEGWSATVVPLSTQIAGSATTALLVLLAAAGLLLAIAVTNVATLTLSSMRQRAPELALRRAIGATHGRLFRQLLAQSALLAALGTTAGIVMAPALVGALVTMVPPDLPRGSEIRVDAPVLLLSSLVAILAAIAFGVTTALKGRRAAEQTLIGDAASLARATRREGRGVLVVAEIALAVALCVGAALMGRSLLALRAVSLGFNPDGVLAARVSLPGDRYGSPESQRAFFDRLLERLRGVPGVASAGIVSARPLDGIGPATTVWDPTAGETKDSAPVADVRTVDTAAFQVLGMSLTAGRWLDSTRGAAGTLEMIVSKDLADRLWPNTAAIGRHLAADIYGGITGEVVGVIGPVRLMGPRTSPRPVLYLSATRFTSTQRDVVVRASGASRAMVPQIRAAVAEIDRALPVYLVSDLRDLVGEALAVDRFIALMLATFAGAALLLAAVGVFGVFSADVVGRRREIGIRLALGSTRRRIIIMLLGHSVVRAVAGIAAGTVLAISGARAMATLLFGVTPFDAVSFAVVDAVVLAVALAATLVPGVRAVRRAPLSALHEG